MNRGGGNEEAAVVFHEEAAQSGNGTLILDLVEDLMQVLQHDDERLACIAMSPTDGRHEGIRDDGVVFVRGEPLVEFCPLRLCGQGVAEDFTEAKQEVGKGESAVRFLRETGHMVGGVELGIAGDLIFDDGK